jgi:phage terminase large subunit
MPRARRTTRNLQTFAGSLHKALADEREALAGIHWPSARYRDDPVGFCHDVLGLTIWPGMHRMLEAPLHHRWIDVRAGRRVSKTTTAAALAWWRVCSFERGQVLLTHASASMLDKVLWGELRRLRDQSGKGCATCKQRDPSITGCEHSFSIARYGHLNKTSRGGWKSNDGSRYVFGRTAKQPSAIAGFGSADCLVVVDEALGVEADVLDTLTGSLAGGGVMMLLYNPSRRSGFAFDASQSSTWHHLHVSALEYIEWSSRTGSRIPGLATQDWVDSMVKKHGGTDSPFVQANVFGEWPSVLAGGIFPLERVQAAQQLHGTPGTEGEVVIGCDPAGDSDSERIDSTAVAVIRGNRMLDLFSDKGLSSDQIVDIVEEMGNQYSPDQRYRVQFDSEGLIGRLLAEALRARAIKTQRFESYGIRSWDKPRDSALYVRIRDELAGHLARWLPDASIVPSRELEEELLAMRWLDTDRQGRARLVDKRDVRKVLRRSPNAFDALCCATYDCGEGTTRELIQRQLDRRGTQQAQQQGSPDRQRTQQQTSRRSWYGR